MDKKRIIEELMQEKERLADIVRKAERRLIKAPEGYVRIVKHRNGHQFYLRTDPKDKRGLYIPVSQRDIVEKLIQKKYDMEVKEAGEKQLTVIDRFLKGYDPDQLKTLYAALSEVRRERIIPFDISDEEYCRIWQAFSYPAKQFAEGTPEQFTSKGECVRSKSEVMIADALYQAGIPYRYECPLEINGVTIHPDFTVLRISDRETLYWEHLGMMDNPEYAANALQRIRMYEMQDLYPGKHLIISMETSGQPINLAVIKGMIQKYCI